MQDKQGELLDQQQRLTELERVAANARRDTFAINAELEDLHVQAQRDREVITRTISTIEQDIAENEVNRRLVILAPQDGIVSGNCKLRCLANDHFYVSHKVRLPALVQI